MINYEEIGNFYHNRDRIKEPQKAYDEQMAIVNDERVHHPEKMTDKECIAYAKAMTVCIKISFEEASYLKKALAKQCLERKPDEEQLATLFAAGTFETGVNSGCEFPPFLALYEQDFLNEYQNSCSIITATAKFEEYRKKIFDKYQPCGSIENFKKMLEINYQQEAIDADVDFKNKKRPYHLSDIKTSLILDLLGKKVDEDYENGSQVKRILSDLAGEASFQAAADRHPALAVTFTNVGEKCVKAAAKREEEEIFSGFGKRLQNISKKYQETADNPHSAVHTR